jgi:hypothetical protein
VQYLARNEKLYDSVLSMPGSNITSLWDLLVNVCTYKVLHFDDVQLLLIHVSMEDALGVYVTVLQAT